MSRLCIRLRMAFFVAASAASLTIGCHWDDATTSRKPPQGESVANKSTAASSPDTTSKPVDTAQNKERELPTAQATLERGIALQESGYLNEALRVYEQALDQPGAPLELLERKALVLGWLKRVEESRAIYQLLLKDPRSDEPGRRRARRKLAELVAWEGKLDEALIDLDRLLSEDPADFESRLLRGQILEWQGNYPEAKVAYSKILEVAPGHVDARRRLDKLLWVP